MKRKGLAVLAMAAAFSGCGSSANSEKQDIDNVSPQISQNDLTKYFGTEREFCDYLNLDICLQELKNHQLRVNRLKIFGKALFLNSMHPFTA